MLHICKEHAFLGWEAELTIRYLIDTWLSASVSLGSTVAMVLQLSNVVTDKVNYFMAQNWNSLNSTYSYSFEMRFELKYVVLDVEMLLA